MLLTVPLASLGGVLGIRFLNLFTPQTLDMLTMVGFIILLGAAVNNAILLVESTPLGRARRHGPPERGAPCARGAHAADLRDLARPARGTPADDHRAGSGRRAVPRPRHRHLRRHAVQYRIHARAPAGAPAPRRARGGEIRGRRRRGARSRKVPDEPHDEDAFHCMVRSGGRAGRILPGGQRGPGAGPGAASGAGHRRARDERQCRHDGLDDREPSSAATTRGSRRK